MSDHRFCPQFQTMMEKVPLGSGTAVLPIRRCLLAERMITLLKEVDAAKEVAAALALDPDADPPRCTHGPDLEPIEHSRCTGERCAGSCSPAYRELLGRFRISDPVEIECGAAASAKEQA